MEKLAICPASTVAPAGWSVMLGRTAIALLVAPVLLGASALMGACVLLLPEQPASSEV
ncbi:MAG TPA: hypothetical protein VGE92_02730 [Steroidobacteraceae bacterium]